MTMRVSNDKTRWKNTTTENQCVEANITLNFPDNLEPTKKNTMIFLEKRQ